MAPIDSGVPTMLSSLQKREFQYPGGVRACQTNLPQPVGAHSIPCIWTRVTVKRVALAAHLLEKPRLSVRGRSTATPDEHA
jgi:hypothetical protein